jgi:hypothetical protein
MTPPTADEIGNLIKSKQYLGVKLRVYTSMKQLATLTGLPLELIKACKAVNLGDAFPANQGVNWKKLRPAFEANYKKLLGTIPTEDLTYAKTMRDLELRERTARVLKLERKLLEPAAVKKWVIELAAKHSAVIVKELQELPPRLAGKSEPEIKIAIDKAMNSIFDVLKDTSGLEQLENEP